QHDGQPVLDIPEGRAVSGPRWVLFESVDETVNLIHAVRPCGAAPEPVDVCEPAPDEGVGAARPSRRASFMKAMSSVKARWSWSLVVSRNIREMYGRRSPGAI